MSNQLMNDGCSWLITELTKFSNICSVSHNLKTIKILGENYQTLYPAWWCRLCWDWNSQHTHTQTHNTQTHNTHTQTHNTHTHNTHTQTHNTHTHTHTHNTHTHLAECLSAELWQESPERLEASIDALHATSLIAVGDLPSDALLLL